MLEKRSIELLLKHCCPSGEVDKVVSDDNSSLLRVRLLVQISGCP